ncbi:zinc finger CCHC domain-containing protein 7 [Plectropomus leopardus]|uniref:zinc finger CCHC domain-containing protein 7 n=1 Tax=Plectropomus leopardus TaxID=160734 RepID=UPI001C4B30C5|nr:zinc finger CCHC domain-containing protein 7 [Plectropomus leopardus]
MYCAYQEREELEDDLYQEDEEDSEGSEVNSELEFRLYSQLHYSSNAEAIEEQEERGEKAEGPDSRQQEVPENTADVNEEQEQTGESRPPSPDLSKVLQQPKKKKKKEEEKLAKQKKVKKNPKAQRSSASVFEEVIVIDSSPDVISISEDDSPDDEEGVCALKAGGLQRLQTSTPAQQGTKKKSLSEPVTVDSSSSESDSEESKSESDSSDSSDSDGLENWMILGREKQDGDQSISLNLEGGSDSNTDEEEEESSWLVSSKDKEARIYNKDKGARLTVQRLSNRYYTNKNVECRNCNKTGHLSKNCPEPKKCSPCFLCGNPGHLSSECPNRHCNNCGLPGHLYDSCSERAYWHKQCHRCGMTGHFFDACPEIWRQYHITAKTGPPVKQRGEDRGRSPAYCYNCARREHFGHACKWKRMFNGTYPSTPFINHYDTTDDIKRREYRTRLKVEELRRKGLFTTSPQTPLTPGPPRKKQKISHHKKNHQTNHTSYQSPNDHKPKSSHIFFNDSHGFVAPKIDKHNTHKQEGTGNVKLWKPKRPVPTSKDPLPKTKLIIDEDGDFPRGGGKGGNMEKKKKKKKSIRKKKNKIQLGQPDGSKEIRPDHLQWTATGVMQASTTKTEKGKRNWRSRAQRNADKKLPAQMYATDENLFIIKQRKRKR